jgi:hypothetical protein
MRTFLPAVTLCVAVAALASGARPSLAQRGPETYPYCALDSSSGATSCYYSSREQCGSRCISNPSYIGPEGAMASERRGQRFRRY